MRIGPFPQRDVESIRGLLTDAGLKFEVIPEDTSFLVDVDDTDLEKLGPELEKFGFSVGLPVPDFHNTDFVCPECGHSQETPGACPKEGTPLLEFSEYAEFKRRHSGPSYGMLFGVLAMVLVVGLAIYFFT